ncbi:MAG: hypothetical protein BGO12_09655 [Verrucomicrobia bacterium 61-8]|nr:D-lyxose/D-mannose family sugar isomerase [Verrucomicrobiota bacterium]OJV25374.1 MAG: hypothetical protein BGO12_09655 [Verrucomicrobia bacterium 61-8]
MNTTFSRSLVNQAILTALSVTEHFDFHLPDYARWSPGDWESADTTFDEIRDCMLGWDVTDFGSGDFRKIGRVLFTLRNGKTRDARYSKPYAEKLLIDPEGQRAPAHYHRSKQEDIICRCGGNLLVQLTARDENGEPTENTFPIQKDGRTLMLGAGEIVKLRPGESLAIPPGTIHQFWGEEGTGEKFHGIGFTLSSEISSLCDDWNDNVFFDSWAVRFPRIAEDVKPEHLLCHEYPVAMDKWKAGTGLVGEVGR